MKKYLLISLLILLSATAAWPHSALNRFWGEVPVDMLLSGDVLIANTLVVPRDVTLTIEAGTVVRFEDSKDASNGIVVRGKLIAQGTKDRPVKFHHKDGKKGAWRGIEFQKGGGGTMEHCVITGATNGITGSTEGLVKKDVAVL